MCIRDRFQFCPCHHAIIGFDIPCSLLSAPCKQIPSQDAAAFGAGAELAGVLAGFALPGLQFSLCHHVIIGFDIPCSLLSAACKQIPSQDAAAFGAGVLAGFASSLSSQLALTAP